MILHCFSFAQHSHGNAPSFSTPGETPGFPERRALLPPDRCTQPRRSQRDRNPHPTHGSRNRRRDCSNGCRRLRHRFLPVIRSHMAQAAPMMGIAAARCVAGARQDCVSRTAWRVRLVRCICSVRRAASPRKKTKAPASGPLQRAARLLTIICRHRLRWRSDLTAQAVSQESSNQQLRCLG